MSSSSETVDRVHVPLAGRYVIDTKRSSITFKTRHFFGLGAVHGTFSLRGGQIRVTDPVLNSSVEAEIDATSFDTGSNSRDTTVRSARYLDTDRHPTMTFTSISLKGAGSDWTLMGTLTVHGITRPVELDIQEVRTGPDGIKARATTRVDRTDFEITAQKGMTGRYLDLTLEVTAQPRD